jgi:competence protein ComEA
MQKQKVFVSVLLVAIFVFVPLLHAVDKVDINTATEKELAKLPGIGAAIAKRIVEYRNAHGGFKSIDELKKVKGIGDKKFEAIKDRVTVGEVKR